MHGLKRNAALASAAVLPPMVPPFTVKAVPMFSAYTPPPFWVALLPEMEPLFIVNAPLLCTYTPPPFLSALLPEMVPFSMVKVPG